MGHGTKSYVNKKTKQLVGVNKETKQLLVAKFEDCDGDGICHFQKYYLQKMHSQVTMHPQCTHIQPQVYPGWTRHQNAGRGQPEHSSPFDLHTWCPDI